jgi:phosphoribosylformylglycinamidine cyclo-ligase
MGHRMELYGPSCEIAASVIALSEGLGVPAQVIGRVEAAADGVKKQVTISGPYGVFTYV